MNKLFKPLVAVTSALAVVVSTQTSYAQQEEVMEKQNWMDEYVTLRTHRVTSTAVSSSKAKLSFEPLIVGGVPAKAADHPFQVGLLTKSDPNNFNAQFCGGTLINSLTVVTAAHCSDFVTSSQVQVLVGTRKLDGSGRRVNVSRITVHPNWNPQTFDTDVAVWRLSAPVSITKYASLASADGAVGDLLLTTGWGALAAGGSFPIDLHKVDVPLVSRANCNDQNSYNGAITSSMLCAGRDSGGKDSCQGDSGGPLTRGANNTVLTGITSWGSGCAAANLHGVYTRVSNPVIRNFIQAND